MIKYKSSQITLNHRDIERLKEELHPLEYIRFRANGKEILIIRSPSRVANIVHDLELMVEMIDIEDGLGLDECYLIADENFEIIVPEVLANIAGARLRIEREYLEKYRSVLKTPYSSKEFIDQNDPISLLRLIIRVPMTESEYVSARLSHVISNVYIADDISIVYLLLSDGYRRITKDEVTAARGDGYIPKTSFLAGPPLDRTSLISHLRTRSEAGGMADPPLTPQGPIAPGRSVFEGEDRERFESDRNLTGDGQYAPGYRTTRMTPSDGPGVISQLPGGYGPFQGKNTHQAQDEETWLLSELTKIGNPRYDNKPKSGSREPERRMAPSADTHGRIMKFQPTTPSEGQRAKTPSAGKAHGPGTPSDDPTRDRVKRGRGASVNSSATSAEEIVELFFPKREPDRTSDLEDMGVKTTGSFPKYSHKEPGRKDEPDVEAIRTEDIENLYTRRSGKTQPVPGMNVNVKMKSEEQDTIPPEASSFPKYTHKERGEGSPIGTGPVPDTTLSDLTLSDPTGSTGPETPSEPANVIGTVEGGRDEIRRAGIPLPPSAGIPFGDSHSSGISAGDPSTTGTETDDGNAEVGELTRTVEQKPLAGMENPVEMIRSRLSEEGFNLVEPVIEGADMKIIREDGSNILVKYTEECKEEDMGLLERILENDEAQIGLMISKNFSYDAKLFIVGKDLHILEWERFINNGLVVEPSWFY